MSTPPVCDGITFWGDGSFARASSDKTGESSAEYIDPSGCCDTDAAEDRMGLVTDGCVKLGEEALTEDWSWAADTRGTGVEGAIFEGGECACDEAVVGRWAIDDEAFGAGSCELGVAWATVAYRIGGSWGGRGTGALTTFDIDCEKLRFEDCLAISCSAWGLLASFDLLSTGFSGAKSIELEAQMVSELLTPKL